MKDLFTSLCVANTTLLSLSVEGNRFFFTRGDDSDEDDSDEDDEKEEGGKGKDADGRQYGSIRLALGRSDSCGLNGSGIPGHGRGSISRSTHKQSSRRHVDTTNADMKEVLGQFLQHNTTLTALDVSECGLHASLEAQLQTVSKLSLIHI